MNNTGLVLEGGGLRGVYTSGVLDYFLTQNLEFNYTIGVSAGAIYSASYASRQKERNLEIELKYLDDERYMGLKYLIKTGNYINLDFAYRKMTYEYFPFDFETFKNNNREFKVGAFNCLTGETEFFSKKDYKNTEDLLQALIATGSLPFLSKERLLNNKIYLDGGIAAPIPLEESIKDGNDKHVIILTQEKEYKKLAMRPQSLIKTYYRKYPKVAKALIERHEVYNNLLKKINELEKSGKVFVIRPTENLEVGRLERDLSKIEALYHLGISDAKNIYNNLLQWLEK
ncbi:patatin family protein [uncultured Cetobacterium sp.]|uniref:patatin-like phospholipase family protein n=1 Tax=uncultured Cetobacterium sp. TaxID=527638 RepID=UPI0026298E37|nr:patatin family protein [uncultured Cetobacterium sp.]